MHIIPHAHLLLLEIPSAATVDFSGPTFLHELKFVIVERVTDYLHIVGQIESNYDEVTDSFDSMNLKSELLRGKTCR